jgi:Mrp family chromosome partitioning ATPase
VLNIIYSISFSSDNCVPLCLTFFMECNRLYRCELCEKEAFCKFNKKGHDDWLKNLRVSNIRKGIIVSGSRGGLGSSLFSALLAEELLEKGFRVGIIETSHLGPMLPYYMGFDFESGGLELTETGIKVAVNERGIPYVSPLLFMHDDPRLLAWDKNAVTRLIEGMIVNVEWGVVDIMIFDLPFYQVNLISNLQVFMSGKLNHLIFMTDTKMYSRELVSSEVKYLNELADILGIVFSPVNNNFDVKANYEDYKSVCLPFVVSVNSPEVKADQITGLLKQPYSNVIKEVSQSCLSIFSS